MPCSDPRDNYTYEDGQRAVQGIVDHLEPKLCHACQILENNGLLPRELNWWWTNHKEQDQRRIKTEAKRAAKATEKKERDEYLASVRDRLRSQLTAEELEAIGMTKACRK